MSYAAKATVTKVAISAKVTEPTWRAPRLFCLYYIYTQTYSGPWQWSNCRKSIYVALLNLVAVERLVSCATRTGCLWFLLIHIRNHSSPAISLSTQVRGRDKLYLMFSLYSNFLTSFLYRPKYTVYVRKIVGLNFCLNLLTVPVHQLKSSK